eukprot:3990903-Pyramimonas_sp.AAC.1
MLVKRMSAITTFASDEEFQGYLADPLKYEVRDASVTTPRTALVTRARRLAPRDVPATLGSMATNLPWADHTKHHKNPSMQG